MAEDYPSPEQAQDTIAGQMDMSSELANQAAAAAAVEAVAAAVAEAGHDHHGHGSDSPHRHGLSVQRSAGGSPDPRLPQPGQGPPPPPAYQRSGRAGGSGSSSALPFAFGAPHRQAPDSPLTNSQQLIVLREFYARNPNPGKKDLEMLAERTGRPWNKIREYFRQRRNKLRGLVDLEGMEEPGRASGWLQVTYRPGPPTSAVSQLNLYNAYKHRFDPYGASAPLLGGQELIQLACVTFPGCEMARDEGDYVLRGLRDKDGIASDAEWDRGVESLVEPLRSTTWLLSNFQHQSDPAAPPTLSQTELYSAYAARFSSLIPDAGDESGQDQSDAAAATDAELKEFEANMAAPDAEAEMDDINSFLPSGPDESNLHNAASDAERDHDSTTPVDAEDHASGPRDLRLLNPIELIALTRMTFPKCEPAVDDDGRFVIRGLERREGIERGRGVRGSTDMFPFALAAAPQPSDPAHPFTAILKRKLALLDPEPDAPNKRRGLNVLNGGIGVNIGIPVEPEPELSLEERELLEGLGRFRNSKLGKEVRDVCVQQ